jgi:hypothetical protein
MENVVRSFLAAVDGGDVPRAMSLLASGFAMRSWDGDVLVGREGYGDVLGWDAVAEGEREVEQFDVSDEAVTVRLVERNRFTELLGLGPFRMKTRYVVQDGKIVDQRLRELSEEGAPSYTQRFTAAMEPILAWAEDHAPGLLAAASGSSVAIRYDAESARALLDLIRRYHEREQGSS